MWEIKARLTKINFWVTGDMQYKLEHSQCLKLMNYPIWLKHTNKWWYERKEDIVVCKQVYWNHIRYVLDHIEEQV